MSDQENKSQNANQASELRKEVFQLRFDHGIGKLIDTSKLKKARIALARELTMKNASKGN